MILAHTHNFLSTSYFKYILFLFTYTVPN